MTNKEWLNRMSEEELAEWLVYDYERLKFSFTSTELGMVDWLRRIHYD